MQYFCLKCKTKKKTKKNTDNINPVVSKIRNGNAIILSKCVVCGGKKSKFIKEQEAKGY